MNLLEDYSTPQLAKILKSKSRTAASESRYSRDDARIRTVESDGLILVAIVANDRFSQHVEGSTKENVVGCFANDVHLQIQRQIANLEWDVASQAQRFVDVAIRAVSDGGGCAAHDRARSVQVPEQDGTAPWGKGDVS